MIVIARKTKGER